MSETNLNINSLPISNPTLAGSVVSGLAGLASGVAGAIVNAVNNKRNIKYQERQNSLNRMDALRQQAYNSEEMTAARLRAAGVNPTEYLGPAMAVSTEENNQAPESDVSGLVSALNQGIISAGNGISDSFNADYRQRLANAQLHAQEAEAERARIEAEHTEETIILENNLKKAEHNLKIKQLDLLDLEKQGKITSNEKEALDLLYQRLTLNDRLLAQTLTTQGLKLSNDLKSIEIKGKQYELDYILPQTLQNLKDQHILNVDKHKLNIEDLALKEVQYQAGVIANGKAGAEFQDYLKTRDAIVNDIMYTHKLSAYEAESLYEFNLNHYGVYSVNMWKGQMLDPWIKTAKDVAVTVGSVAGAGAAINNLSNGAAAGRAVRSSGNGAK